MHSPMAEPAITVSVAYSPGPRRVQEWTLTVAVGTTVRQALTQSGVFEAYADVLAAPLLVGVWGKRVALNRAVQPGDRLEIYRSLRVDPKVARRERFNRQGAKPSTAAGLFAKRRAGAKAGY